MRSTPLIALMISLPLGISFASEARATEVKSAEASAASFEAPNSANFDRLEALFQVGTMPSFPAAGTLGMAGRCFDRSHEDAVKGAAYLVHTGGGRNGPIDPATSIQTVWDDDLGYFDHLSSRGLSFPGSTWFPVCASGNSVMAVIGPNSASYLRRSGDYWVEKIATIDDGYASYYCYYYLTMAP
ncbi:MAG: hypothetical protein JST04_15930 [Bdellovibrionales bacterium]|nr:hypothetical protein [Bdellovibrionales bacterium]